MLASLVLVTFSDLTVRKGEVWQAFSLKIMHMRPISKTGFVHACSVAVSAEHRPSWLLDQPNRLWELDTTWYPGADAPEYLDGSLGVSLALPSSLSPAVPVAQALLTRATLQCSDSLLLVQLETVDLTL